MGQLDKSELDRKSYRIIQLENGLRAILVSDLQAGEVVQEDDEGMEDGEGDVADEEGSGAEEDGDEGCEAKKPSNKKIQMSAGALCINAGSFHEQGEVQGLAHYLEHMVFMGSEKYPTENDFDAFVSQRGGSYNAWTDCEMTLFYLDVHKKYFGDALDRFANFFIAPLLLAGSMDREVTAVDSEFKMSLANDSWRIEHFLGTLADPDHPYSFFMIGNVESLKTEPTVKGVDVYRNLQERRKRMYSAQYMTVAVQSKETLDDLEKLVREIFTLVPNNGLERPVVPHRNPFRNPRFQGHMYKIVPIKDIRKLIISWVLPPLKNHYKSRPYAVFGFLLGHEAKGSILSYLRKKNLAVALSAGCYCGGFDLNECATLIRVDVQLTEEGLEKVDEVIWAVYAYCAVLRKRGVPKEVYEDIHQLSANAFRFQEAQEPMDYVCLLAENMHKFPEEHVLSGNKVYYDYDGELYASMMQHLLPAEANYLLLSMKHDHPDNKVERWYEVRYSDEDIPKEKLDQWLRIEPDENTFHLPMKNEFIAKDFSLIKHDDKYTTCPVQLELPAECAENGVLWYMQDTKFKMPKAMVQTRFFTSRFIEEPRSYVLAKIMVEILHQTLADVTYDAEEADLRYDLTVTQTALELSVEGFNDKLFKLYSTVVDFIRDFAVESDKFDACKEKVRQELVNYAYQPRKLYGDLQYWSIFNKGNMVTEQIDLLSDVVRSDLENFAKSFWSSVYVLTYVHGNHTPEEAVKYFAYSKKELNLLPTKQPERMVCAIVPEGEIGCRVMNLNPCDVNTVIVDYYQVGAGNLKLSVELQLMDEILSEPCFNFLRTQETLGYAVWFRRFNSSGVLGVGVHVESQADKFTVDHCLDKMREFIAEEAKKKIMELSEEDFQIHVSSLISSKLVEDVNMGQIVRRNWDELLIDNLLFCRREKEVELLQSVKKSDIVELFERTFFAPSKRQLVFEVNALEKPKKSVSDEKIYHLPITMDKDTSKKEGIHWVSDVAELRANREFHPYVRIV